MRGHVPSYELVAPGSLAEALALLPQGYRPFSGGTDVMVTLESGRLAHTRWVSLWSLTELRGVEVTPDHVTLGALTTYTEVREHPVIRAELPSLADAARLSGALAIQNRGTVGGNIANASPAADTPPALLAYGAELELVSSAGRRWVPYEGFHTGYKTTALREHELIARVRVARPRGDGVHFYRKVGTRNAQAISKVCVAAFARREGGLLAEVRVALGSVAPTVVRARSLEAALSGRAVRTADVQGLADLVLRDVTPIDDIRSTAAYRARVARNVVAAWLTGLAGV